MNRITVSLLLIILAVLTLQGKVLFIVDADYYNSSRYRKDLINNYKRDVEQKDNKTVDIIRFNSSSQGLDDLWKLLRNEYRDNKNGDAVEGAVFIGDIPVAQYYIVSYGKERKLCCDYIFMDLWDFNNNRHWTNWDSIWRKCTDSLSHFFDKSYYNGDGKFEIWVSRIYSKNIKHLREDGQSWGTFLEEYEIIDQYLERLSDRMNTPAKVPPRGLCMGKPPGFSGSGQLEAYLDFKNIKQSARIYFDETNIKQKTAVNWQAQLQKGPWGNINAGSFEGTSFNDVTSPFCDTLCKRDNRIDIYANDTAGYEWASCFVHSNQKSSNWEEYSPRGCYTLNGTFHNFTKSPPWQKIDSGGYAPSGSIDDSYYICRKREQYPDPNPPFPSDPIYTRIADWSHVIKNGEDGEYFVFMYYILHPDASDDSWINIFVADSGSYDGYKLVTDFGIDQTQYKHPQTGQPNWEQLYKGTTPVKLNLSRGDTVVLKFHPLANSSNDAAVADAVKLYRKNDQREIIIDNTHIFDIEHRDGFRCCINLNRGFCNMRDDGGPSKVPFFYAAACEISNFYYSDNLGLLYAMGHSGLIMMGNAHPNTEDFSEYTESLGNDNCFGKAFLSYVNSNMSTNNAFNLFGAGTLKPQAYIPYYQNIVKNENFVYNDSHGRMAFAARDSIILNSSQYQEINNNGFIELKAGKTIRITGKYFRVHHGSYFHAKAEPSYITHK